jgi:7-cyano-7-deazaguanine synthase
MPDHSVVLVSGGMDSLVTLAIAAAESTVAAMHVNYGQRTESRELHAFQTICDYYRVEKRLVVDMSYFAAIGGNALTDESIALRKADLKSTEIPTSYVPFRNANFLSAAVAWGEVIGAQAIYIGAVEDDSSGYPDCRRSFYDAFSAAIREGTKPGSGIIIRTPIIGMSKREIVLRGAALNAPFELSWSCYASEDVACGECDSCALRLRAFSQAGIADPVPYRR